MADMIHYPAPLTIYHRPRKITLPARNKERCAECGKGFPGDGFMAPSAIQAHLTLDGKNPRLFHGNCFVYGESTRLQRWVAREKKARNDG